MSNAHPYHTLLPRPAQDILRMSASTGTGRRYPELLQRDQLDRMLAVNAAVASVHRHYPHFFKKEQDHES